MKKFGVIDLGSGNVFAIENVLRRIGVDYSLISSCEAISECSHVILPGVGAFDDYISRLKILGLYEFLKNLHSTDIHLLGICIGMHVLGDASDEGCSAGLGLVPGKVKDFDTELKLPHMGWNAVSSEHTILDGVDFRKGFYFLHNYHFVPKQEDESVATASYGGPISCVINKGRVFGTQFHPEKSHMNGQILFRNFLELR